MNNAGSFAIAHFANSNVTEIFSLEDQEVPNEMEVEQSLPANLEYELKREEKAKLEAYILIFMASLVSSSRFLTTS